ncbi:MAG TPA: glucoamylase family protein, partial [Spirochaetia bacterium]|nr:glucoamylase family protein [Spirochaetia bacterium]
MPNEYAVKLLRGFLPKAVLRPRAPARQPQDYSEQPLRSELFSLDQMRDHGKALAESHHLQEKGKHNDRLLARLVENEMVLNETRARLTEALPTNRRIAPAADWLLDNFYLIEEHIRTSKRDLPKGYSRELPCLKGNRSSGLPRVYDIALERISHGDGNVDPETLRGFLEAYQSVAMLTLGELWAIPIMLRLALIENVRRVAVRISAVVDAQSRADSWADRMTDVAVTDPKSLILLVADMARSDPPMVSSFVAELARKLQGKGSALALPLTWIEQRLFETGLTIERLVQTAMQQQAADQVSMSNSIRSLRSLDATDWKEFVESTSDVDRILREDPGGYYGEMDFATRDRYRHVVEGIARRGRMAETDVATAAVHLAHQHISGGSASVREAHVGYYLVDRGLELLERAARVRASFGRVLRNIGNRIPLVVYLGSVAVLTISATAVFVTEAHIGGLGGWRLWPIGALAFLGAGGLSIALVNWLVTLIAVPKPLARMDFSNGIPPDFRTLVVVPAMLSDPLHIERLIEALEVRFLANRDDNLFFGLLTDLPDASAAVLPQDGELIRQAQRQIEELNNGYRSELRDPFFLFHRARQWNAKEKTWMGYERKRGKLADLNGLLRGGSTDRFDLVVGRTNELASVKYVITLDTDTQLPRDAARQLIGTMAHPLNRPHYDEERRRIAEGYGILQPRVSSSLTAANRSRYSRMRSSEPGIDPYTRAVSDVYQDLFGEGSFIGKGIYDVDAFERVLRGRLPEDRILSHDLLEGCYARSGLLSDVQLFEESPTGYRSDVIRQRRWIRGDWQLGRWLFPTVPGPDGQAQRNTLSPLSRWKLLDNLRRSVAPAALTLLLLLGWTALRDPALWTLSVLGILLIPSIAASFLGFVRKSEDTPLGPHFVGAFDSAVSHLSQALFALLCLPYEAYFSLASVGHTIWRMLITHRGLLEWQPSDGHGRTARDDLGTSFRYMWIAPSVALATSFLLRFSGPTVLAVAAPFLGLWLVSPVVVWWLSRPFTERKARLSADQTTFLRRLSRKTWAFFETFVTEEENWLPPDNYQEVPTAKIAHRTSPTNMGLCLLSNLAARDFGYLQTGGLIERTARTLRSMSELELYRNHFYNWYDTLTRKPLLPRYVSTVDSGNLAAHLLTLRSGLLEIPNERILGVQLWEGIGDTMRILAEAAPSIPSAIMTRFRDELESGLRAGPSTSELTWSRLERLTSISVDATNSMTADESPLARWWAAALERQCREAHDELAYLLPWIAEREIADYLPEPLRAKSLPSYNELSLIETKVLGDLELRIREGGASGTELDRLARLADLVTEGRRHAEERVAAIEGLVRQIEELSRMDFEFLYDQRRRLFTIGYNVDGRRQEAGCYDLLASEARLTSFIAIAQGQAPQETWFALGRLLADAGGKSILFSWSGSMFEYLMPLLVMPSFESTLLDQTCKAAIVRQIEYGRHRNVPWGISESGYNSFDAALNYQYRAFGVPGLGLKRGLVDDLVVAPYASALALLLMPEKACMNLKQLSDDGCEGDYGFYEAIDYTETRIPPGQPNAVVKSFMVHHQGMSFLSLASRLLGQPMQKRFQANPEIRATALLLEERIPRAATFYSHAADMPELNADSEVTRSPAREFTTAETALPEVHLLSNGSYHVMVTNAGGGYSRWRDIAVTRWREDATSDNWGAFLYVRDVQTNDFWSNTFQPTLKRADNYDVIFSEGRAEFRRRDHDIETYTEMTVSPEDDIELRRVRIANRSRVTRTVEITSYAEVVMEAAAADATHPAFGNLFVETEIIDERQAILCTRRRRSSGEAVPCLLHLMTVRDAEVLDVSYETDRMLFIGRGNDLTNPSAMTRPGPLPGGRGPVLDPIVAIRKTISLEP